MTSFLFDIVSATKKDECFCTDVCYILPYKSLKIKDLREDIRLNKSYLNTIKLNSFCTTPQYQQNTLSKSNNCSRFVIIGTVSLTSGQVLLTR